MRLIRSKGVGVFFVTQTPKDVPADVLGQLGSRVQHALRAFTPDDATAMKATARTFPHSPYDLEGALTTMGIGEAVVTVLSDKGAPTPVAWTRLCAPRGLMDPAPNGVIEDVVKASPQAAAYGEVLDRESAYEKLAAKAKERSESVQQEAQQAAEHAAEKKADSKPTSSRSAKRNKSVVEQVVASQPVKTFARQAGREVGRQIMRSRLGVLKR